MPHRAIAGDALQAGVLACQVADEVFHAAMRVAPPLAANEMIVEGTEGVKVLPAVRAVVRTVRVQVEADSC